MVVTTVDIPSQDLEVVDASEELPKPSESRSRESRNSLSDALTPPRISALFSSRSVSLSVSPTKSVPEATKHKSMPVSESVEDDKTTSEPPSKKRKVSGESKHAQEAVHVAGQKIAQEPAAQRLSQETASKAAQAQVSFSSSPARPIKRQKKTRSAPDISQMSMAELDTLAEELERRRKALTAQAEVHTPSVSAKPCKRRKLTMDQTATTKAAQPEKKASNALRIPLKPLTKNAPIKGVVHRKIQKPIPPPKSSQMKSRPSTLAPPAKRSQTQTKFCAIDLREGKRPLSANTDRARMIDGSNFRPRTTPKFHENTEWQDYRLRQEFLKDDGSPVSNEKSPRTPRFREGDRKAPKTILGKLVAKAIKNLPKRKPSPPISKIPLDQLQAASSTEPPKTLLGQSCTVPSSIGPITPSTRVKTVAFAPKADSEKSVIKRAEIRKRVHIEPPKKVKLFGTQNSARDRAKAVGKSTDPLDKKSAKNSVKNSERDV